MESADERTPEEIDRAEEAETPAALDEAFAELERGEGRRLDEGLPALRHRPGINRSARDALER
jgi:hypothetical protein